MSALATATAVSPEQLATEWIDLVFPGHAAGTFDRAYPTQPFLAAGSLARFEFARDQRLLQPELTIASSPCSPLHTAFVADGCTRRQQRCTSEEALALFRQGCTISIESGGKVHPGLEQLAIGLAGELGLERAISPALNVSPAGEGTPVHFDGLEVVILQLAGKKRWRFAASQIEAPDFPFFPGEQGAGARGGRGAADDLVLEPPASTAFQSCVLEPGSTLFLPRGWWHETEALEDSISVTVRLPLETTYCAVATEIVQRLRQQARWRRVLAQAVGCARRRPSPEAIAALVREAVSELARQDQL